MLPHLQCPVRARTTFVPSQAHQNVRHATVDEANATAASEAAMIVPRMSTRAVHPSALIPGQNPAPSVDLIGAGGRRRLFDRRQVPPNRFPNGVAENPQFQRMAHSPATDAHASALVVIARLAMIAPNRVNGKT